VPTAESLLAYGARAFYKRSMLIRTTKPLLVFGGCYSNLEATRAVLGIAERVGFDASHIICTGDVVAYCADPQATVDLIRNSGIHVIMGNCEESLAAWADNCGCGFEEGSTCDRLSSQWYSFATTHLDADSRKWMGDLPQRLEIDMGGRRLAVIHGGSKQINRFIFESTPISVKQEEIEGLKCDGVIAGHCGLPFTQLFDDHLWHNTGALGMPANDGTCRTWYSILHPMDDGIMIEALPLIYSAETASDKMRACGLTGGYDAALLSGIWPSADVLPATERRQQGVALDLGPAHWPARKALVRDKVAVK
jgi:predicted phosphodiesterase